MGSFYTNITLRSHQARIIELLEREDRTAYVAPTVNGCTVVCDKECDEQDTDVLQELAALLSRELQCVAFAVLNHDDDVLMYWLYENGTPTDRYDSTPDYFSDDEEGDALPSGGDAYRLCRAFGVMQNVAEVEDVLRTPAFSEDEHYLFAIERHADLVAALGTPSFSVGLGYTYIEMGSLPPGLDPDSLRRVG
jgi:hypothetical protein